MKSFQDFMHLHPTQSALWQGATSTGLISISVERKLRARRKRGHPVSGILPLHLSIYRWSGGPFASSLTLASKAMTRF